MMIVRQSFFSSSEAVKQEDWRVYGSLPLNRPNSPTLFNAFKIEKFGYIKGRS